LLALQCVYLNRVGPLPQSEDLTSPELYKTNSKALMQVRDHIRGFEKIPTSKELAKKLLGVVEADPSEEAVSIRKED